MERRYKAFISYSWADKDWGGWLHRSLELYRTPRQLVGAETPLGPVPRRLHPIFKDREEEAAGHGIGASIEAAMGASEFLIVICSPRSAKSKWVNREVAWFKTHKSKERILALVIDGEPGVSLSPGKPGEECFPKTLLYKVGDDLQPTDELEDVPLAADARKEGDGKRLAKLKLAAAMLGVGLDGLIQRDDRRRAGRRRLVTAALASLAVVLGGLSIFAFNQRDAARIAQADAEFQRDEAQNLIEFMLTDLRQNLDRVGRLDILDSVAKRLLQSYAKQDIAKLDPDALGRRARVLLLLGEVDAARGQFDGALARYKEAAATTGELLSRDPDNQQRIFDHAQSVYWVGDIAWKRGDIAEVTDYWTQYRDFGARLVALDPDKDEWQTELGYGHRNLGVLTYEEGSAQQAVEAFARARNVSKRLAEKHPEDSALQIVYADDLSWLAIAQEKQGAFADAEETLAEEEAVDRALLRQDADSDVALQRLAVNRRQAAWVALSLGHAQRALAIFRDQESTHQSRIARDPDDTNWLSLYSFLELEIADAALVLGEISLAQDAADNLRSAAKHLASLDPGVLRWRLSFLGGSLATDARIATAQGDFSRAAGLIADAVHLINESRSDAGETAAYAKLVIATTIVKARIARQNGNRAGAVESSRAAISEIEPIIANAGPRYQHQFFELCLLAGESSKAKEIASRLDEMGYRHPDFIRLKNMPATQEGGGDIAQP